MKCECGKIISRYMKGKCMACRYKEKLGGVWRVRLKIPIDRLPKPPLPPTRPVRIGEVVSDKDIWKYIRQMGPTESQVRSARRGLEISTKARRINQWTPEKDEELLGLRAEGKTYDEIVTITGRTRSAVEHRLGLLKKQGRYSADWKRKGGKS
jgi:hypothetical protein